LLRKRFLEEEWAEPFKDTPFLLGAKASEVVLEPFFKDFYKWIGKYNSMPKRNLYLLAAAMKPEELHTEIIEKLDCIASLALD
jgi:hypothetical protein